MHWVPWERSIDKSRLAHGILLRPTLSTCRNKKGHINSLASTHSFHCASSSGLTSVSRTLSLQHSASSSPPGSSSRDSSFRKIMHLNMFGRGRPLRWAISLACQISFIFLGGYQGTPFRMAGVYDLLIRRHRIRPRIYGRSSGNARVSYYARWSWSLHYWYHDQHLQLGMLPGLCGKCRVWTKAWATSCTADSHGLHGGKCIEHLIDFTVVCTVFE